MDSLVEAVVALDAEGRVSGINRAACELLEVAKGEAIGANFCELLGTQWCESAAAVGESIRRHRPVGNVQVEVQTRSGRTSVLVFQATLLRGREDRVRGSVVVFRDVRELAAVEEAGASSPPIRQDGAGQRPRTSSEAVRGALAATGWNVAKAARRLGISRTTLYKRIAALGLQRPGD